METGGFGDLLDGALVAAHGVGWATGMRQARSLCILTRSSCPMGAACPNTYSTFVGYFGAPAIYVQQHSTVGFAFTF